VTVMTARCVASAVIGWTLGVAFTVLVVLR